MIVVLKVTMLHGARDLCRSLQGCTLECCDLRDFTVIARSVAT
jgi:hypothetical protein